MHAHVTTHHAHVMHIFMSAVPKLIASVGSIVNIVPKFFITVAVLRENNDIMIDIIDFVIISRYDCYDCKDEAPTIY